MKSNGTVVRRPWEGDGCWKGSNPGREEDRRLAAAFLDLRV